VDGVSYAGNTIHQWLIGASPNPEVLEGTNNAVRTLIIEFPDMASLKAWYDADEYQPMKEIRQQGIDATLWLVDGAGD